MTRRRDLDFTSRSRRRGDRLGSGGFSFIAQLAFRPRRIYQSSHDERWTCNGKRFEGFPSDRDLPGRGLKQSITSAGLGP